MILSQLIRGAAEELISRPGELVDPVLVAAAMARAAERAYGSVRDPAEGTILTVVREMAARVASEIAHMDEPRLSHRVDDATQNEMLAYVLEHALDAGQASVKRGPELLPILRDAGVVDAGGYGLTIIFAGVIAALRGADAAAAGAPRPGPRHPPAARVLDVPLLHELRRHGRASLEPAPWIARAGAARRLGARRRRRAHAEGPRPHRRARARRPRCSRAPATVSRLDVADMHEQVAAAHASASREAIETCGVLAVVVRRRHARAVRGPRRARRWTAAPR